MKFDKYIAILIGIVVSIFLCEIIMRVYNYRRFNDSTLMLNDNGLVYAHKPSINFTNKYGIEVEYNSLGFIGKEVKPKGWNVLRILGIGDSITAAGYLPTNENYLNRIGEMLSEATKKKVEVINAAVGGYNSWQELDLLQTKGLLTEPDLIIVGICLNDFVYTRPKLNKGWSGGIFENYRDGSKARYLDFLYKNSDFYKFLYDSASNMRRGMYGEKYYCRYLQEYNFIITAEDFEKWKAPFLEMMSTAKAHNARILFVIFPLANQVVQKSEASYAPLSYFFRQNKAYYVDLIGYLERQSESQKPLFLKRDIIHLTSAGHKISAEAIVEYITKSRILQ